jgi:hypothetical protein
MNIDSSESLVNNLQEEVTTLRSEIAQLKDQMVQPPLTDVPQPALPPIQHDGEEHDGQEQPAEYEEFEELDPQPVSRLLCSLFVRRGP